MIRMCADFQDPVEMIVQFVREWEQGHKIVIGVKKASKEKRIMYWIRACYYKLIRKITDIDHIEQFTGFGLYDKAFVDVVRSLHDPMPYLRGIIAELGFDYKAIPYVQQKRRAGKSKNNFIPFMIMPWWELLLIPKWSCGWPPSWDFPWRR